MCIGCVGGSGCAFFYGDAVRFYDRVSRCCGHLHDRQIVSEFIIAYIR